MQGQYAFNHKLACSLVISSPRRQYQVVKCAVVKYEPPILFQSCTYRRLRNDAKSKKFYFRARVCCKGEINKNKKAVGDECQDLKFL